MPTILLFAATTGYQIRAFGEAARSLGVRLVLASDRCDQLEDPWCDGAIPVRFGEEPRPGAGFASVDAVLQALDERPAGVLAVGDRPVRLASRVAAALGCPWHPPAGADASANKLATRRALAAAGLPVPVFREVGIGEDVRAAAAGVPYPAVVKPLALSGSQGVMRVDDAAALDAACARLARLLQSPDLRRESDAAHDRMLVESFIPGDELALEGVLTDGVLHVLALFEKPDPLDGPCFEETLYVRPSWRPDAARTAVADRVSAAAAAIGLRHGPVHAECRVNDEGIYVLEVAARPIGGLCAKAVRLVSAAGVPASLEEVLLRQAAGEDVTAYCDAAEASGVMMIPIPRRGIYRGVDGVEAAALVPGVESVQISAKLDSLLLPLPEGRSYLGFLFASGPDAGSVERSLRDAHAQLRFRIERDVALLDA